MRVYRRFRFAADSGAVLLFRPFGGGANHRAFRCVRVCFRLGTRSTLRRGFFLVAPTCFRLFSASALFVFDLLSLADALFRVVGQEGKFNEGQARFAYFIRLFGDVGVLIVGFGACSLVVGAARRGV